jgi:hypothetical protein
VLILLHNDFEPTVVALQTWATRTNPCILACVQVLERAKEGESLEELRARTASQFSEANGEGPPTKRRKQAEMDDSRMSFGHFAE